MSLSNGRRRRTLGVPLRPIAVWGIMVLFALGSIGAAYLPSHAAAAFLHLAIAAMMVILLWLYLMDLVSFGALIRIIAAAGLLWLSFMFGLTFSDYLFRRCETPVSGRSAFCIVENIGRRVF